MRKKLYLILIIVPILFANCKDKVKSANNIKMTKADDSINAFVKNIDGFEYTKLGISCRNNNLFDLKILISKGADVSSAKRDDINEYDALYVAIENNHIEIVDFLINNKANLNRMYSEEGLTALGLATKLDRIKIVQNLITGGANVNVPNVSTTDYKETPLLIALKNNNLSIAKILISAGADINDVDIEGRSIKDQIILEKDEEWKALLSNKIQVSSNLKGEYFAKNDKLDDFEISIKFEKDSIIYTETGNMGKVYNQFTLRNFKIEKDKIFLKYDKTLNGYTGNANKNIYFGIITIEEKEKLLFESDYLKVKFNIEKTLLEK